MRTAKAGLSFLGVKINFTVEHSRLLCARDAITLTTTTTSKKSIDSSVSHSCWYCCSLIISMLQCIRRLCTACTHMSRLSHLFSSLHFSSARKVLEINRKCSFPTKNQLRFNCSFVPSAAVHTYMWNPCTRRAMSAT